MRAPCIETNYVHNKENKSWLGFNAPIPINQKAQDYKRAFINGVTRQMEEAQSFKTMPKWKQNILIRSISKALDANIRCTLTQTLFGEKPAFLLLDQLSQGDGLRGSIPMTESNFGAHLIGLFNTLNPEAKDGDVEKLKEELQAASFTIPETLPGQSAQRFVPELCGISVMDDEMKDKDSSKVNFPQLAHLPRYTYLEIQLLRAYENTQAVIPCTLVHSCEDPRKNDFYEAVR